MTIEEVFTVNQTISDRLAKMCQHDTTEDARHGIAAEVRQLVTQLCLAIVGQEKKQEQAPKEIDVL